MYPDHQRRADGSPVRQVVGHPGQPVGYPAGQPYGGQVYGSNAYANQYVNHNVVRGTAPGYGYQGGHEYYTHG